MSPTQASRRLLPALLGGVLLAPTTLQASALTPVWSFANVSANYLDWSDGTEARTADNAAKGDFFYLEAEGGAGFSWGEFYGFYDLENPGNSRFDEASGGQDNRRTAAKLTSHIYLGDSPFSLYAHVYDFRDYGFEVEEQDRILGLGYRHTFANGLWIKPFLGRAWVESGSGGFDGGNGYMLGWVAGYDFSAFGQDFSLTQWHEQTFDRDDAYLAQNYVGEAAGSVGTNGAVSLWWHPHERLTAGVQYRYAHDKLGTPDAYQNAMIYTLKFNLL